MLGLGLNTATSPIIESFVNTKSLSFDGVEDSMSFSSNPTTTFQSLLGASSFTISYWVKAPDIVQGGNSGTLTLAAGVSTTGGFTVMTIGRIYGPNHSTNSFKNVIEFNFQGPSGVFFQTKADHSSVTLSDDTWIHIAYTNTINGSSRDGLVYINGSVLTNNSDFNSVPGGDFSSESLPAFAIGATFFNSTLSTFSEISLDEIAFYNTDLTASQVSEIYNSGVPRDELEAHAGRLVGYWRLEDNGTDGSANGNDFTVTGATFSTSVPT